MHPGWAPEFPCPLAKQEKCPEVFSNTVRAAEHVNIFHRGKIQCRYHEATGCEVMFEDTKAEYAHAALKHIFHLCNVAGCVDTVMGRPISKRHWLGHMRIHARSANIPEKSLPTPTLMVLPIKTSEVYKESRLTESEGAELDNGILDGEESFDTDELSQSIYPVAAATLHLDAMEERRVLIQERTVKSLRVSNPFGMSKLILSSNITQCYRAAATVSLASSALVRLRLSTRLSRHDVRPIAH